MYQIPNNEVDQLRLHTRAYLQSISQIPIVNQILRSRTSHRRTQPYGKNETLPSSIEYLIIDTIFEIQQLIAAISQPENQEDLEFPNLLDFPEEEAGVYGPLKLLETNITSTNPPSPWPNFNFLANIVENRPWLVMDAFAVPDAQHRLPKHLENILPKFDHDNDVTLEDHIKQFMLSPRLMDVQHEDVV